MSKANGNILKFLPDLTFNGCFVDSFALGKGPNSLTLGVVEERKKEIGFIAIRPLENIPENVWAQGFNLGQRLIEEGDIQLIHFVLSFYRYHDFHIVLNPNNKIIRHVLNLMRESLAYFFFVFEGNSMSAFRGSIDHGDNWFDNENNLEKINNATTTDCDYEMTLKIFKDENMLGGTLLSWIYRENLEFINLSNNRVKIGGKA